MELRPSLGIPFLVLLCVSTVAGTLGNIMILGAVLINKKLQKVSYGFVVNLALTDLCVNTLLNPFSIVGLLKGHAWFDVRRSLCDALGAICMVACMGSLFSITAVSVNRFFFICHNKGYQKVYTVPNTILMCVLIWIIAFLMDVPALAGWSGHSFDNKTMTCVWDRTASFSNTIYQMILGVILPVVLTCVCYIKIFLFVAKQKKALDAFNQKKESSLRRSHMKLAKTLFVIFIVFVVCWLPYAVLVIADVNDTFPLEIHLFATLLAHINSSLNFILYGLQDKNFQEGYRMLFGLNRCQKNVVNPSEFSNTTRIKAYPNQHTKEETIS